MPLQIDGHAARDADNGPATAVAARTGPSSGTLRRTWTARAARLPRWAQVLLVWAGASLVTLLILVQAARGTAATVWADASPSWSQFISFWDSGWYERIARAGYPSVLPTDAAGNVQENVWAFMPLLPYLSRALAWTGTSFYIRGAVIAIAASAAAAVLLDRWLAPRVGRSTSLWAVALMWCSPCAAVLQVPYAESLALALVVVALLLVEHNHVLLAVPAVVLAPFARPVGVPLAASLGLWWLWETARARGWLSPATAQRVLAAGPILGVLQRRRLVGLTIVSAVAAVAWPLIAWASTGQLDAYTASEASWRRRALSPFTAWVVRGRWWVGGHLGMLLLLAVLAVGVIVLTAPALRALGVGAWSWCLAYSAYLLVFFDPTTSLMRILLPLAPVAWAVAARTTPRMRWVLLAAGVVGQVFWVSWVWSQHGSVAWIP